MLSQCPADLGLDVVPFASGSRRILSANCFRHVHEQPDSGSMAGGSDAATPSRSRASGSIVWQNDLYEMIVRRWSLGGANCPGCAAPNKFFYRRIVAVRPGC